MDDLVNIEDKTSEKYKKLEQVVNIEFMDNLLKGIL